MKVKKTSKLILLVIILILLVIPVFVNWAVINNDFYSKATNDSWVSFLGSYLGGILGGFATLIGVLITLKSSRIENMKPMLMLDIEEESKAIYDPSYYSQNNSLREIRNYDEVPNLVDIFGVELINTGKGYAQEIEIVFSVKIKDALITDNNKLWLSLISPLNKIEVVDEKYIQYFNYSFLGSEGETKTLPLNLTMNGLVISSLWNIENSLLFSDDDFLHSFEYYKEKMNNKPLTIPSIEVNIRYCDMDHNQYESVYTIAFDYIYHQIGSYSAIKPRIEFFKLNEKDDNLRKRLNKDLNNKNKNNHGSNLSKKTKRILELKKLWSSRVYKFGQDAGFEENISEMVSNDEALERFFYNAYNIEIFSIEDLIYKIAFAYLEISGELLYFNEAMIDSIVKLGDSLFEILGPVKRQKIVSIMEKKDIKNVVFLENVEENILNKTNLRTYYFRSYEESSGYEDFNILVLKDGKSPFEINVNIGSEKLKTEVGFFRRGYTYKVTTEDRINIVQTAAKRTSENSEFGFLDYSGYLIGEKEDWECIYLR